MKIPQLSPRIWLAICAFLLSVSVILAVVLVGSHRHSSRGPKGGMAHTRGPKLGKIHRLDIPAEQKQLVRAMFKEHRRSHRVVAKALRQAERQLQRALVDPNTSKEQLRSYFAEINAQQRALQRSRFQFTLKLRDLIGAENMKPLYRPFAKGSKRQRRGDREDGSSQRR